MSLDGSFLTGYPAEDAKVTEGGGMEVGSLKPVVQFAAIERLLNIMKKDLCYICIYKDTLEGAPLRSYAMEWVETVNGSITKTRHLGRAEYTGKVKKDLAAWSVPAFGGGDKAFLVNYTVKPNSLEPNEAVFLKEGKKVYIFLLTLKDLIMASK